MTDADTINIPHYSEDDTEAAGGEDIYGADGNAGTAARLDDGQSDTDTAPGVPGDEEEVMNTSGVDSAAG